MSDFMIQIMYIWSVGSWTWNIFASKNFTKRFVADGIFGSSFLFLIIYDTTSFGTLYAPGPGT